MAIINFKIMREIFVEKNVNPYDQLIEDIKKEADDGTEIGIDKEIAAELYEKSNKREMNPAELIEYINDSIARGSIALEIGNKLLEELNMEDKKNKAELN